MNRNGWSVLRVWNADVLRDRKSVLDTILAAAEGCIKSKMISAEGKFLPAVREVGE
jgi:very-short-patch-repair endonuclease